MKKQKEALSVAVFIRLLKEALTELLRNDPLRLAGATAFFTTFALPCILIILIQGLQLFLPAEKARQQLEYTLSTYVGPETVKQILKPINAINRMPHDSYILIGGFLFLLFVATNLFKVLKSSLNQVWKIKVVHRNKVKGTLIDRFRALIVILVAGVLFAFGLLAEGLHAAVGRYVSEMVPQLFPYYDTVFRHILSIIIVTVWFAVLLRYLPDARLAWNVILSGALLTSVLFILGKSLLRWLLSYGNINNLYGASASMVLLMLFVFYSSFILYFGAAFTKVWSGFKGQPIEPRHYATHYQLVTDDDTPNES